MINKNLVIGGALAIVGMFMLVMALPALLAFRYIELSNDFTLGAFSATLLQVIVSIALMYYAYKYLRK